MEDPRWKYNARVLDRPAPHRDRIGYLCAGSDDEPSVMWLWVYPPTSVPPGGVVDFIRSRASDAADRFVRSHDPDGSRGLSRTQLTRAARGCCS